MFIAMYIPQVFFLDFAAIFLVLFLFVAEDLIIKWMDHLNVFCTCKEVEKLINDSMQLQNYNLNLFLLLFLF